MEDEEEFDPSKSNRPSPGQARLSKQATRVPRSLSCPMEKEEDGIEMPIEEPQKPVKPKRVKPQRKQPSGKVIVRDEEEVVR